MNTKMSQQILQKLEILWSTLVRNSDSNFAKLSTNYIFSLLKFEAFLILNFGRILGSLWQTYAIYGIVKFMYGDANFNDMSFNT